MIGQTISHYKILEKLGEGGMGVVYKAQDTKLNRTVALKFLPEHISASESDTARFMQEAQAAASLNHPNICTIHGIEEADGKHFIVMEFVDGQMLQEKKTSLSMKQALDIGIQIAEGLAAAHDKGIVHRDIKPENIMIRKDGRVQVMDFGLAKLRGASRLTKEGSTVGTVGYMSPEQVQGQDTDHRSDIFSLGVLLFEMFTGQLPFKGVHETAISYEIVNVDSPPLSSIKTEIAPELDSVVLECLEKDPNERTQSAKQVAVDLTRFKKTSSKARVSRVRPVQSVYAKKGLLTHPGIFGVIIAITFGVGLTIGFLLSGSFKDQLPPRELLSSILPPNGTYFADYSGFNTGGGHFSLSSDGSMLAHVSPDSLGRYLLWIRKLGEAESIRIEGSIGAAYPFWSPDNRSIGFFAEGKLKALDMSAGSIAVLADAPNGRGGAWLSGNKIVFASTLGSGLYILDIASGDSRVLTVRDTVRGDLTHRWPHALPNGTSVIYLARTTGKSPNMWHVVDVSGEEHKDIAKGSSQAEYSNGHLLFAEGTTIFAVRFDPGNLKTEGEPFPVYTGVQFDPGFNRSFFSVSRNGLLVFRNGPERGGWDVFWVNSRGKRIRTILQGGEYYNLRQSPDRRWMAFTRYEPTRRNRDIHILDLERGVQSRFTFQEWYEDYPVWSPDSRKIVFGSQKAGVYDLYVKNAGGGAPESLLYKSVDNKAPTDWSGPRNMILFTNSRNSSPNGSGSGPIVAQPRTDRDIWALSPDAPEKAFVVLQTPFDEYDARFSPDGRWITYVSNESGKEEVYVRSFTASETRVQVSVSGGVTPKWNPNGKEIFFWTKEGTLMSAAILSTDGRIRLARAEPVFVASIRGQNTFEEVSGDGRSFLLTAYDIDENLAPLSVSIGWEVKGPISKHTINR